MPLVSSLVRAAAATVTTQCAAAATSAVPDGYDPGDVVCAWPVSGQYGPGSRFLYYVLVAGCVLGRGNALLRGACLAAALLIPAVASIHAIVLAAVHVNGAVDMDIYGALQICAIGVLAGPVTVKLSATYFNTPGRNLIFVWTTMLLAGLLSLAVEFFRVNPTPCPEANFSYNPNGGPPCGLQCFPSNPTSPLRGGAQNNIYVIPVPTRFSFSAAILICAACCIPAVLSLISMWNKILKLNWTKRFGKDTDSEIEDRPISGTNAATPRRMTAVNLNIKFYLSMVEIPIFGCAIVAILIIGELNLFSTQVFYQTEPFASVGQWAPISGTVLAISGSLYAFLAAGGWKDDGSGPEETGQPQTQHCQCHHHASGGTSPVAEMHERPARDDLDLYPRDPGLSPQITYHSNKGMASPATPMTPRSPNDLKHIGSHTSTGGQSLHLEKSPSSTTSDGDDMNSRHRVARMFEKLGNKIGTPAPGAFDDAQFRKGLASNFPMIPGERERNEKLRDIEKVWEPERDSEGNATPLRRQRSRAGSFRSEISVNLKDDGPSEPGSPIVEDMAAGPSTSTTIGTPLRRATTTTLQVPGRSIPQSPRQPRRSTFSSSVTMAQPLGSPTIQISEHDDTENDAPLETPLSHIESPEEI